MFLTQSNNTEITTVQEAQSVPPASAGAVPLPLLATKLAVQASSLTLLPRPRLTARLQPTAACRLALVVAPVGSGKSSVVSQWCQESDVARVAWLSLDAHDNDPNRFLHYLCAALERVAPAAAAPVRLLLQAAERPTLEYALTLLLNGVAALERPVTLVLDDYHAIEATAVHAMVHFLVEHLPPSLFLIIATRRDPLLPLARLRLRGQVAEIRAGDLRFTHEEAAQFLNERMGLTLTPETVERLAERTEGWIAGLQLAALSLQGAADASRFLEAFSGSDRYLVDYLCEEVLRRQPREVQTFLGQTALLKRVCAPLCEAMTGAPGGQAMLERLEAANLFLVPLDRERRWYRYHHLFAEVLRARLLPEHGERRAVLHARAAAWYEAEGMAGEAIEHALLAAQGQADRAASAPRERGASALIEPLSDRQLEVLRLVVAGLSNNEIAAQLFLAVGTVKQHLHQIYGKLAVTSCTGAVSRARALALMEQEFPHPTLPHDQQVRHMPIPLARGYPKTEGSGRSAGQPNLARCSGTDER